MPDRPVIVIDPASRFGAPQINGIRTGSIAEMVAAGESVATVAGEYDTTRHAVLLACWHEAAYRPAWKAWANDAARVLGGWDKTRTADDLEDPPTEGDQQ